jgi:SAM-dependent methyltransferase
VTSLLYDRHVDWWELLSPESDHAREVKQALSRARAWLPRRRAGQARPTLLELGSGAGLGTLHLARRFDVTAVDRSAAMLRCGRQRNPQVRHIRADMRTLNLQRRFDVTLCYDAIDHLSRAEDARRVVDMMARHTAPGGVVIIAPAYCRETFGDGESVSDSADDPRRGLEITYLSRVARRRADAAWYEWTLTLLVREGEKLTIHEQRQRCGLFGREQWERWMTDAGLRVVERPSTSGGGGGVRAWVGVRDRAR